MEDILNKTDIQYLNFIKYPDINVILADFDNRIVVFGTLSGDIVISDFDCQILAKKKVKKIKFHDNCIISGVLDKFNKKMYLGTVNHSLYCVNLNSFDIFSVYEESLIGQPSTLNTKNNYLYVGYGKKI